MVPILNRISLVESGDDPNAQNPNSTAGGPFQFINGTWKSVYQRARPDEYASLSEQEILARKKDTNTAKEMAAFHLQNDINPALMQAGFEPTPGRQYLGWFAGVGGAPKVLSAPPGTPISQLLGPEAIRANANIKFNGKSFADFTNDDLIQWADAKMSGAAGGGGGSPSPDQTVPAQDQKKGFNIEGFGNSLVRAAAALASINSPEQSAALLRGINDSSDEFSTTVNAEIGKVIQVNKRTGETRIIDAPGVRQAAMEADRRKTNNMIEVYRGKQELARPNAKFITEAEGFWKEAGAASEIASRVEKVTDALDRGVLNPDILSRTKDLVASTLNMSLEDRAKFLRVSEEQAVLLSDLETLKNKAVLKAQLEQKGVQTEGDAVRITNAMFTNLDMIDPVKLRNSLGNLMTDLAGVHKNNTTLYEGRRAGYKNDPTLNNPETVTRLSEGGAIFERHVKREEERKKAMAERQKQEQEKKSGSNFDWMTQTFEKYRR